MQSIIRGWNRYRPHLLAPIRQGLRVKPDVIQSTKPLYERRPPWWARFTYTFILTDLAVTAAMAELAFDAWTIEKEPVQEGPKPASGAAAAGSEGASQEYVLRPLWQRLPVAGAQMVVGVGIAIMILTSHARVVRRLRIVPASSLVQNDAYAALVKSPKERFLHVDAASNKAHSGNVFPLAACTLERGADDSEMKILADGIRGNFWVGLPGAQINGEKTASTWNAREILYEAFYGEEGKKIMTREGWQDGPLQASKSH